MQVTGKESIQIVETDVRKKEHCMLKTVGERKILAVLNLIKGADTTDDERLLREIQEALEKYVARVSDYLEEY